MEDLEKINSLLEEIKTKNTLVVVEGIKDKRALETIGITHIMTLRKSLYAVAEEIAARTKEVILLTDLDTEGRKLFHTLSTDLQKLGVRVDNRLREALFKTPLRHIEGLATYLKNSRSQDL